MIVAGGKEIISLHMLLILLVLATMPPPWSSIFGCAACAEPLSWLVLPLTICRSA